jgi:hypothetical protein
MIEDFALRKRRLNIVSDAIAARLAPVTRLLLAEIRRRYVDANRPLDTETEAALKGDPRAGAKAILDAIARRRAENRSEGQRLRKLLQFESALWGAGVLHVAGVDEAGMSPLAGPVAAAAPQRTQGASAGDHQWRRQKPDHCRRLDPRKDGPRRPHAHVGRRISRIWLCEAQGLSRPRSRGRSGAARRLACSSPLFRPCPHGSRPSASPPMGERQGGVGERG